jgi:hypothetical protein
MSSRIMMILLALGSLCGDAASAAESNTLTEQERADGWQLLFDGESLHDWRPSDAPGTFSVRDGSIVVHGPRSHLYYVGPVLGHDFGDFELELEVLTFPGGNSGVYFHTEWQPEGWPEKGYEVQVNNSHTDPKRTAGLYDIDENYAAVARDGVWFKLRVRVEGRWIRTYVDGRMVSQFVEPEDYRPPLNHPMRRVGSGTFALQGHDPDSEVHFRSLKVRALR